MNRHQYVALADARIARSARPLKIGTLRPAIVLYDEPHPLGDDIGTIQTSDVLHKPDMLIVMGTSLKVHGLKKLVKDFAKAVHASSLPTSSPSGKPRGKVIFVNKTAPSGEWSDVIDYHVEGETDRWVEKVIEDWKKMRPADWELQQTLVPEDGTSVFKTVKRVATVAPTAKGQGRLLTALDVARPALIELCPANKKKPAPGSENVPPVVPSDPEGIHKKPKSLTPPLSPSKRRQPTEHYSDGECSPSKKRGVLSHAENLSQDERVLLFVEEGTKAKTKGSEKLDAGAKAAPRKVRRAKSMCVLVHHIK
jgi:NAD+-dependent protein deacetylase SIR2